MREIEFRGKRKDNGQWVYGAYFCLHHNDGRDHIHHFIIPNNLPIPKEKTIGEIQVEVAPETLGQYTGMDDKNGKKIYEKDIVVFLNFASDKPLKGAVKYYGGTKPVIRIRSSLRSLDLAECNDNDLEVLGNIHDNPEKVSTLKYLDALTSEEIKGLVRTYITEDIESIELNRNEDSVHVRATVIVDGGVVEDNYYLKDFTVDVVDWSGNTLSCLRDYRQFMLNKFGDQYARDYLLSEVK